VISEILGEGEEFVEVEASGEAAAQ